MPLAYLPHLRLNHRFDGAANGPVLVLSHALGFNLSIWDHVIPLLPPSLRILRYDHRGHGASDTPPAPYTMGGIQIDADARVRHEDGSVIPGLYAAGAATGGIEGGPAIGYTGGLSKAAVFGFRAAEHATAHVKEMAL